MVTIVGLGSPVLFECIEWVREQEELYIKQTQVVDKVNPNLNTVHWFQCRLLHQLFNKMKHIINCSNPLENESFTVFHSLKGDPLSKYLDFTLIGHSCANRHISVKSIASKMLNSWWKHYYKTQRSVMQHTTSSLTGPTSQSQLLEIVNPLLQDL